jgi:hypothetical protein
MMHTRKLNPRAEHRLRQTERVNSAATLAEKYPKLKSLTANLLHFDPLGLTKTGEVRYTVNVLHAKSLFFFACPSTECAGGDFDLSAALADAVRGKRKIAAGEVRCEGTRTRPKGEKLPCGNLLRYKLTLRYA